MKPKPLLRILIQFSQNKNNYFTTLFDVTCDPVGRIEVDMHQEWKVSKEELRLNSGMGTKKSEKC